MEKVGLFLEKIEKNIGESGGCLVDFFYAYVYNMSREP
jgi:hypothetical protein